MMLLMVSAEAAVLVRVADFVALFAFIMTVPKSRLAGTSFTVPIESVIVATADLLLSVADVEVTVTAGLARTADGAV